MKRMILSLLLTGSSLALWAQEDTIPKRDTTGGDTTSMGIQQQATDTLGAQGVQENQNMQGNQGVQGNQNMQGNQGVTGQTQGSDSVNTMRSTGAYGAYGNVPTTIQNTFMSQHPSAANATWEKDTATNMWRARYTTGGRIMSVFMDERGNSYSMALPIVQSLVSENVISSAINKFGPNVYDVLQLRTSDSTYVYQVRLLENGQVRAVHINEDGSDATYTYAVHETDSAGTNMGNNMNNNWNNNQNNMNNANTMDSTGNMNNMNKTDAVDSVNTNQDNNMNNNPVNQTDSLNATPDQGMNNMNDTNSEAVLGNNNTNTENRKDTKKKTDDTQTGNDPSTNQLNDQNTNQSTDQDTNQNTQDTNQSTTPSSDLNTNQSTNQSGQTY